MNLDELEKRTLQLRGHRLDVAPLPLPTKTDAGDPPEAQWWDAAALGFFTDDDGPEYVADPWGFPSVSLSVVCERHGNTRPTMAVLELSKATASAPWILTTPPNYWRTPDGPAPLAGTHELRRLLEAGYAPEQLAAHDIGPWGPLYKWPSWIREDAGYTPRYRLACPRGCAHALNVKPEQLTRVLGAALAADVHQLDARLLQRAITDTRTRTLRPSGHNALR